MKNLKKVLSLVLALAMAFSLMSVALAADKATDFTDYGDIDYQEAVNVLTSIGVINGVDDGNTFNPTGTLTREQGAKIITYMLLGQDAADQLTTAKAPFTDVPASRWSAGAIAYCAERGILAGTGDGTFKPEDTLTGYAFAKMLLIALEYDPTAQGYTGSGWALNVAGDAVDADIDIAGLIMSNNLTREQAAKMAYNTLVADIVYYPYGNLGTTITTSDGTTVVAGATRPEAKAYSASDYISTAGDTTGDTTLQFVEKYFPKLKLDTAATDGFKRPGQAWTNYATNETLPITLKTPVKTYTASTKAAQVASDLSVYKLNGVNITNNTATDNVNYTSVYENGYLNGTGAAYMSYGRNAISVTAGGNSVAAQVAELTKDGRLVEFYANSNNEITRIVTIGYTVGEVTSVTTTSTQTNYVINGVTYRDFVDSNASDTISVQNGATLAVGDIVTFAVNDDGVAYVWPTTKVTGTQSSKNTGNKTITVAGTVYPVAVGVYTNNSDTKSVTMRDFDNSSIEGIYYIDQYGYVVKTTTVASNDYAYVIAVDGSKSSSFNVDTPSIKARLLLSDGTVVDRSVALTKTNGTWYLTGDDSVSFGSSFANDAAVAAAAGVLTGNAFTYSLTDTQVTLKRVATMDRGNNTTNSVVSVASDSNIKKNTNSYAANGGANTVLVNNSTKFVVYSPTPNTAVVYTGSANLPNALTTSNLPGVFVAKTNDGNNSENTTIATASVVFIETSGAALTADVNNVYAYVTPDKVYQSLDGNTTNYVYTATLADGSTVELTSTTPITTAGIYTYNESTKVLTTSALATVNGAGVASGTDITNGRIIYDNNVSVVGSLVQVNGSYYSITSDTKTVFIDENLGEVNNNGGYFVLDTDSSGSPTENVAAIFITVD